jgi:hypothetical protein
VPLPYLKKKVIQRSHAGNAFIDSRPALNHLQYVGACEVRAKKAVLINLADVSNLVADRHNLAKGGLKPLLCIRLIAQTMTNILLNVRCEEQR